ncbi:hypothetical protein V6N13_142724 [Hibiscus sabdariffa]
MGDSQARSDEEQPPPAQIPLLSSNIQNAAAQVQRQPEIRTSNDLDDSLEILERFLTFLGFNQSSLLSFSLSWAAFTVVGVLVPVLALELSKCDGCEMYQIKEFETDIVASQACMAAVSLFCVSFNLKKYGLRRYVNHNEESEQHGFHASDSMVVASLLYFEDGPAISLSASILFHVLCNLQVIHFDDYAKLLERESDVLFLVVTVSQFVTLLQTTVYAGTVNFINSGDFAISSIVQVVGIILCLHAATRISHRAQGIASFACRWHALATCTPTDASLRGSNSAGNMEVLNQSNSLLMTFSESDLDSVDYISMPTTTQLASYMSSYHRRQAFVMYLQANPGGITIFGWTVDRGLINTIFFIELSLVTFVLGQTVVFGSTT